MGQLVWRYGGARKGGRGRGARSGTVWWGVSLIAGRSKLPLAAAGAAMWGLTEGQAKVGKRRSRCRAARKARACG